jgi:hypothetical protein
MLSSREVDARVAAEVFGHSVSTKNNELLETTPDGEFPLGFYSSNMQAAWTVAEKMRVTIIPIEGGQWFAFIGNKEGWESPQSLLEFLQGDEFANCGAEVGDNAPLVICKAALRAVEKRKASRKSVLFAAEGPVQKH